jgi:hypothetical protein
MSELELPDDLTFDPTAKPFDVESFLVMANAVREHRVVRCAVCGTPIAYARVDELRHPGLYCAEGCTAIEMDSRPANPGSLG